MKKKRKNYFKNYQSKEMMKTHKQVILEAEALAEKFVKKVRTGKARSVETYQECLALLESIEEWREIDNGDRRGYPYD